MFITIEASNNNEFAQNYMYEFYEELLEDMPWELSYSIDYDTVFNKLQMTMSIQKILMMKYFIIQITRR